MPLLVAQTPGIHLPWWIWPVGAGLLAARLLDEHLRTARKRRHRAYLNSSAWKAKRRDAIARAGSRCQDCGSNANLHVHHLTYTRHGNEPARDLRVLCARCHRRRHRDGRLDDLLDRLVGWFREPFES